MSIPLDDWLYVFGDEYLADFIPSGGSTVKLLVAPKDQTSRVVDLVRKTSENAGFATAVVRASETRAHMLDQIFFKIAQQIDWEARADSWMSSKLVEADYVLANGHPLSDISAFAEANGKDVKAVGPAYNRIITENIIKNSTIWNEFRNAVAHLCVSRVSPRQVRPESGLTIVGWLRGDMVSLPELKNLRILQRIGKHNARAILKSTARWLRDGGVPGVCVVLDLTATFDNDPGSVVNYTRANLMDVYEILRQFIDETDETTFLAVVAVAGLGVIESDTKSYENYDAIKQRLVNDVRDSVRDNPLNTLVRLEPASIMEAKEWIPNAATV